MADDKLMTRDEFNAKVEQWSELVQQESLAVLVSQTNNYSGNLRRRLRNAVANSKDTGEAHTISFKFMRYGVFVAYGVGRGYAVINGVVVRGHRLKEGSAAASLLSSRGYSKKELAKTKIFDGNGLIKRHPVDWLDMNIRHEITYLADIAGDYYGDKSLQHVLDELNKITIKKTL